VGKEGKRENLYTLAYITSKEVKGEWIPSLTA
jgi:hypothetical protein